MRVLRGDCPLAGFGAESHAFLPAALPLLYFVLMQILVIDAALAGCQAAVVYNDSVLAARYAEGRQGQSAQLAGMVQAVLAIESPNLIAVTLGPGSFSGIRAALSLAHGVGLALGIPVIGVTVGEAFSEAFIEAGPPIAGRQLWCAITSRRGRVFLERDGVAESFLLNTLPRPRQPVVLAGDAAMVVAASLAAQGADVMLTTARIPRPRNIADAARRRHLGILPPRASQPVYVDAPEVSRARPPGLVP